MELIPKSITFSWYELKPAFIKVDRLVVYKPGFAQVIFDGSRSKNQFVVFS